MILHYQLIRFCGARTFELQNCDSDTESDIPARPELMIQAGQSASVVPVMARKDGLDGDCSSVEDLSLIHI